MEEHTPDGVDEEVIPNEIWNEIYRILDKVSDECGQEELSNGDILKYEGWSANCFEDIDEEFEGDEEEYAASQTPGIVNKDWAPKMARRRCKLIESGYEPGGLYGVTWAIFRRLPKKTRGRAN